MTKVQLSIDNITDAVEVVETLAKNGYIVLIKKIEDKIGGYITMKHYVVEADKIDESVGETE